MSNILHNATVDTLLERRSIRKFKPKPLPDDVVETLETVAQHAASSQFLNDWSAIRVTEPATKKRLAEIGGQPYIATAPLLYVFVLDEHRNAAIAARYAQLVTDPVLRDTVFSRIKDEFELTRTHLLTIVQQDELLADNPLLRRSIRNRFPYMDPLNHLQVELLRRHRAGESDERIQRGIHMSINGIAAGLRNSG